MRSIPLALAAILALVTAAASPALAQQDIEIEEAPADDGAMDDLGVRRPGQQRAPVEPPKIYGTKGFYAILAGTYAAEDLSETKKDIEAQLPLREDVDFSNSLGFNARAGYRWHPNLAGELQFEWIDEFELENTGQAEGSVESLWSLTANAKAFLSTGRFEPFAVVGMGYYSVGDSSVEGAATEKVPDNGAFGVRGGGGIEIYLTENLALNTEATYNFGTADLDDLRYLSFSWGVLFKP